VLEEIADHARSVYPREAVGLAGGPSPRHITRAYSLTNIAADDREFLADPFEHWRALNQIRQDGLTACAAYHSHPDGGVGISEKDLRFASASTLIQIVVSISVKHTRFATYETADGALRPLAYEEVDD
jgi:proteasome lid subunit RPN8/RPN11